MLLKLILYIHILFGALAFCSAPLALVAKKGGLWHTCFGLAFSYGMYVACSASFIISIYKQIWFLFVIGIFSGYLVISARRFLGKKNFKAGDPVPMLDLAISQIMLIAGAIFILWGIYSMTQQNGMGIVLLIFGLIGFLNARTDLKIFKHGYKHPKDWLLIHIGRMIGGTTAAYTAFLVQNAYHFPQIPGWIFWLLPNIIFVPLSIYFIRKEKQKYAGRL